MVMSYVDLTTLHNDCNISHTLMSLSNDALSNALENLLEKACPCTLNDIISHLGLKIIDIRNYSKESQLQIFTRLASERFHSICFTDSDKSICIKSSLSPDLEDDILIWHVEKLKEYASRFMNEASPIPIDMKLHLACLAEDHQCLEDAMREAKTTDLKEKNMFIFYGISCGKIVDVLVNSGVDVNTRDARGRTPLFYALISSLDSAKKLLDTESCSVTRKDNCRVSILTFFADKMLKNNLPADVKGEAGMKLLSERINRAQMIKDVINLILCKFIQVLGTIKAASNPQNKYLSPNMLCKTLELVNTNDGTHSDDRNSLISQLQSVQQRIAAGTFAVSEGPNVLQSFEKLNADPSAPDSEGNTCLHYATHLLFYGVPEETVTDLCHKLVHMDAKLDAKNYKEETPLLFCLSSKHLIASMEKGSRSGSLGKVCQVLMEKGSKLRHTNHKEESAFHLILKIFQCAIILPDGHKKRHMIEEMFEILSKFTENGQKQTAVCKRDIHLNSPLHLLASLALRSSELYGKNVCDGYSFEFLLKKILGLLLQCGVMLDDSNKYIQTPLHMCRTWTAVKLLLDTGAEPDVKDSSGCTPLLAAAKRNTCIEKDSKNFYPDVTQTPNEFWKEVLNRKLDPWTADKSGESVLSILIKKEANVLAKALIEAACDQDQQIDLLIAVCKDQSNENHWKLDLVKLLLDSRRNLARSPPRDNNDTALHFSCRNILELHDGDVKMTVHWKIAEYLLLCGADINAAGETGESCLALSESCSVLKDLLTTQLDHSALPLAITNWEQSSQSHAHKLSLVARMVKCEQVGSLSESLYFNPEALDEGKGSGSFVFAGINHRGREVAVKRIDKSKIPTEGDLESVLVLSRRCDQIVECLHFVKQGNFYHIAFELMEGDLTHYLNKATGSVDSSKLCKDLVKGLNFLQSKGIVHGNINPRTVFYQTMPDVCLKIGNCKASSPRRGWVAPEVLKGETSFSKQSDIFSCGLVIHYLLSGKKHPFAPANATSKTPEEVLNETDQNITNGNIVKIDDSLTPEATHLVQLMLDIDPNIRPSAGDVMVHPFFWDKRTKKEFLNVVGNEPELAVRGRPLSTALESHFSEIVSTTHWNDSSTYSQIYNTYAGVPSRRRRPYNFGSVADLIRFIRNIYQHINEHTRGIQMWWENYCVFDYFPRLVIEVYKTVRACNLHNSSKQVQQFFEAL